MSPWTLLVMVTVTMTAGEEAVMRDFFGDIFRMPDCHNGSRCDAGGSRPAMHVPSRPCYCQCAPTHLAYREDRQQCVKDIKECYMSVFYRPFTVEAIPLVYLPTSGQLVHPDAHLSLAGRKPVEGGAFPTCKASVSQYLTKEGWRTLTRVDGGGPVFGLFTDGNKTFLQFLGNSQDRRVLQQHLALVRLFCKIPQYSPFETCVAIRVGWVPGIEALEDEDLPSTRTNMMVIGFSIGILGLVYVLAVLIYLKIRRQQISKRKSNGDQEACIPPRDDDPDKPSTKRLETSKRLELYHTNSLRGGKTPSWSPSVVETYNRTWTDRMQQGCEFKAQDLQLQPEFFEPEYMASPPQHVLEYLQRLQSSVTFARHRLRSCYRYQPTLNGIPEDDYFYQELERKGSAINEMRTTPDGGSASSVTSLLESEDQDTDGTKRKSHQKIPPKKPKRKSKLKAKDSASDIVQSSDQEQEIQNAMNTLNETLEALEYDIYKHDLLHKEDTGVSCPNSTEGELDEFDTSSCSSLSAVTVLGRDLIKKNGSTGSRTMERNLSEEFSTFRNSIYSGREKAITPKPPSVTDSDSKSIQESGESTNQASKDVTNSLQTDKSVNGNNHADKTYSTNNSSTIKPDCSVNQVDNSVGNCSNAQIKPNESSSSRESSVSRKPRKRLTESKTPNGFTPKASTSKGDSESSEPSRSPKPCHDENSPTKTKDKRRLLKKSSSSESMTTISTDMTSDSLDSRSSSPSRSSLSPTPSLVDLWLSKLIQSSMVQSSRSRRKSKKKLVLPDADEGAWEHVCRKQQQHQPAQESSCPMHDLKDTEPNLIDKLAHYSSKTMAGRDVAGYFQSLKQDVLKEHLKSWLVTNSQGKNHKKGISVKYRSKESSGHTKPLVTSGGDLKLAGCEHGALWANFNKQKHAKSVKESKSSGHGSMDSTCELIDSLDSETLGSGRSDGKVTPESTKVI